MFLYEKLEFNYFLNHLKSYCFSEYGKRFFSSFPISDNPEFDYNIIKILSNILKKNDVVFNLIYVDDILDKLRSTTLEANELYRLKQYFDGVESIKRFLFSVEDLALFFSDFMDYSQLIKKIDSIVDSSGKVKDTASDKLFDIRKQLFQVKSELKSRTGRILNKYSQYLQDRIVTFKNGRLVLPFKSSFKNRIDGIIQDISSTGSTVFIEPKEFVVLSNLIRDLESQERYEVIRILTSISYKIKVFLDKIFQDQNLISFFDSLYARSNYLLKESCTIPKLNSEGYIKVITGRNPIINSEKVVPLDFKIGKENRVVVITGPNTGGKTVTLKTIGLFSLMAKMAIPIPAEYAELSLFNNIFVDIGDEQAIEQNLSTFSSHMKMVIKALKNMDKNTLILFDELGAGTDPMEGSALAIAIVDKILSSGAIAVITTHYNELKLYAYSKKGIENASMQFDLNTLQPTYKLLMGIPGSSNAFEIAKRLGMDADVIEKAREFKGKEYEDIDNIIKEIHKEKNLILTEKEKVLNTKKELELKMYQYDSIIEKVKKEGIKSLNRDYERLKQMKKEIEEMVSRARRTSNLYELKKTNKEMETFLKEVKKFQEQDGEEKEIFKDHRNKRFSTGDWVNISSSVGKIIEIKGKRAKIDLNGVMIESDLSKLRKASPPTSEFLSDSTISYTKPSISSRIDLRGYKVEDAIEKVEDFIYRLRSSGLSSGTILHGKGTGALMQAIHKYLRVNPHIKNFRFGMPEEGGEGVTIIEV